MDPTDQPRVVIALCFASSDKFFTIPDCPYCHSTHKHRVPDLVTLETKHCNGDVVPYHPSMATKISDCLTTAHIYALELRSIDEIPQDLKRLCRGITTRGTACTRRARAGTCVCVQHMAQLQDITKQQVKKLFET